VIAQAGQPVLDVGCGTGRLLLDYMQQGIDVDGMDNSPEMPDQRLQLHAGRGGGYAVLRVRNAPMTTFPAGIVLFNSNRSQRAGDTIAAR